MQYLVRYGAIPEVARCRAGAQPPLRRGDAVVIESHRGLQMASVVEVAAASALGSMATSPADDQDDASQGFTVVRSATAEDQKRQFDLCADAEAEFQEWVDRIQQWKIDVQLIDLEWTLDRTKRVLYVLNDRGPECTKLAIQAAAAGLGIIEVQPVSADGLVSQPSGGGCGSGGCGCHN